MMFDNDTSIPLLLAVKLPVTALGAYLSGERGLIFPVLLFLFVSMIVDWITGVMADKANGKPITSKTFSAGIFKKVSYLIATGLGLGFDWLLHVTKGGSAGL